MEFKPESGCSNNLERESEVTHGAGSSMHPDTRDPEIMSASGSSESSETRLDFIDRDASSNNCEINPEMTKGWGRSSGFELHSELRGLQPEIDGEGIHRNGAGDLPLLPDGKQRSSSSSSASSSSSSSSGSSVDDLFQVDAKVPVFRMSSTPILNDQYTHRTSNDEPANFMNNSSSKPEECSNASPPTSISQASDPCSQESTSTQSPPIQVMDRSDGYDPNRIPSSVFSGSKSSTPMEWSIASNESLFSIHVGNNSFSRDHVFNFKSGELFKSGEFIALSPSPPPVPAMEIDKKKSTDELEKIDELDKSETAGVSDERQESTNDTTNSTIKDSAISSVDSSSDEKIKHPVVSWNSSSISNHSETSGASTQSFAFPIRKKKKKKKKKKKCAWPSCYCSNCSWAFCYYCTWPSCNFKWPSCYYCSNCSWAFCYCWNCSPKRWCCHSSSTLTGGRSDSVNAAEANEQQQEPLSSRATSNSDSHNCCRSYCCCCCFPSCQWCCSRPHCCWC